MTSYSLSKTFTINGSNNRLMAVDLFINFQKVSNKPIIIFCHGYKGFKDWGCWSLVAEKFANEGFNFIKFNFSHNGVTPENSLEFSDLEAFGNNNYSKELFDLEAMIDWVVSDENEFKEFINIKKLYLIGHSRGGGIVSLQTAKDDRIIKVVTWASVCDLIERLPKEIEKWRETGVIYQLNSRTNQEMPLFYQFFENSEMNKKELSIKTQGRKIKVPFCIIHGMDDKTVPLEEAEELNELIPSSQLILLKSAGHTFGASHPWNETNLPPNLHNVVKESIEFFTN
jgi:uncharacterized protein